MIHPYVSRHLGRIKARMPGSLDEIMMGVGVFIHLVVDIITTHVGFKLFWEGHTGITEHGWLVSKIYTVDLNSPLRPFLFTEMGVHPITISTLHFALVKTAVIVLVILVYVFLSRSGFGRLSRAFALIILVSGLFLTVNNSISLATFFVHA